MQLLRHFNIYDVNIIVLFDEKKKSAAIIQELHGISLDLDIADTKLAQKSIQGHVDKLQVKKKYKYNVHTHTHTTHTPQD